MNDLHLEAVLEFHEELHARKAELLEMERILAERDDILDYAWKNGDPIVAMCGCRPKKPCDWHQHVQEQYEGAQEEV